MLETSLDLPIQSHSTALCLGSSHPPPFVLPQLSIIPFTCCILPPLGCFPALSASIRPVNGSEQFLAAQLQMPSDHCRPPSSCSTVCPSLGCPVQQSTVQGSALPTLQCAPEQLLPTEPHCSSLLSSEHIAPQPQHGPARGRGVGAAPEVVNGLWVLTCCSCGVTQRGPSGTSQLM